MSKEIMLSVSDFYKTPSRADDYRKTQFTDWHRPAWDSGGFQFLMGKLPNPDPMRTVDVYKRVGVKPKDLPVQLDLPPTYHMPKKERLSLINLSAEFYWRMIEHIPFIIPVVHGWDHEELCASLELLEDPDKLATGSNIATAARNEIGVGAFFQSGRYILDEAGNLKKPIGAGAFMNTGGTAVDNVTSDKSLVVTGSYSPTQYPWSMGNLNPHSCVRDRIGVGAFLQSGQWSADYLANTPTRKMKKIIASPMPNGVDIGQQPVIDRVNSKVIATPYPSNVDVGWKNTILTNDGMKRKKKPISEPQKKFPPVKINVIIDRLATVLNMFRDRELFMLGGGSSHTQHMCFLGGAKYSDTSSWRMKGYFGEILVPEIGARSIGYKDTSTRLKKEEIPLIAECLRDSTHPLEGMPVNRFLTIGRMNMTEWRETWPGNEWEIKPFPLRAMHNAWVLKMREEVIANEYANDPIRYYNYLLKRFEGRRELTRRLNMLWKKLKRPWVQTQLSVYLKGGKKGIMGR